MKIQEHNDVVVAAAGLRRKRCSRGREAPRHRVRLPSLPPPLYRPPGGRRPWEIQSPKGAAAKGGGVPPKACGAPPTLGFQP